MSVHPLEQVQRKPTVCLVDDDDMMLSLFSRVLHRSGCDVVTAKGPEQANEILAMQAVDVVISDLRMPDIADGKALLESLRQTHPALAVWMMSSEFSKEMRQNLMNAGAAQCIEKPFNAELIGRMLDQLDVPGVQRTASDSPRAA